MLAHQGGWDEFLFAAAPIALIAGLLALANKRASRHAAATSSAVAGIDDAGATPGVSADPESD